MKSDRRSFLKTSGALGGALLAGGTGGVHLAQAQTPPPRAAGGMVQGFTFCTLRKGEATTLGIKT